MASCTILRRITDLLIYICFIQITVVVCESENITSTTTTARIQYTTTPSNNTGTVTTTIMPLSSSSSSPNLTTTTMTTTLPPPTTAKSTTSETKTDNKNHCPAIENGDEYTQAEFLQHLTNPCRYDRLSRPPSEPANVFIQIDLQHLETAENLQFKLHMLLQYRYLDPRLAYGDISPVRSRIVGEESLRSRLWIPHILLENERESAIMGHDARDVYMDIDPNGQVTYARRVKATLYCWMNLQKFPFDEQNCEIRLLSWTYNMSELVLKWEEHDPVIVAEQLHITEYTILGHKTVETVKYPVRKLGAFTGNHSRLIFRFHTAREIGFYVLDYFIPSIMLVTISWVSFWLQADAAAPRITLGTSTMLSFITLATAQTRTLPKVSYIKASEVWFLGCTIFIFGSMVEFAFVNIIWRRKSNVELKKVNSKYILKSTLTPKLARKELHGTSPTLQKSYSYSSLVDAAMTGPGSTSQPNNQEPPKQNSNYLTVHGFMSPPSPIPTVTTNSVDELVTINGTDIPIGNGNGAAPAWTTMTPQQISQWIDRRSRLVFPCAFLVFNAFYWSFVCFL